ncbi:hypothetical protein [Aquirufa aurantiipilula]|uniref:hypothetical protein n=1 Tax=Aquirufa aurantiipilula TaxID=2696561 RepID=UPI001CAA4CBD|nr:hypothetical protein [Aquirufa aurantiipilula]MBZ1326849.1 hypothetical protein [Aquirufa aurantiipilula]
MHFLDDEIDKMFITTVISGNIINTGSFWAKDIIGQEFFADAELVKGKIKAFEDLQIGIIKTILVLKEIWGGKWKNQEVNKIIYIGNNLNEVLKFKDIIKLEITYMKNIHEIHDQQIKNISMRGVTKNEYYEIQLMDTNLKLEKIREEKRMLLSC